MTQKQLALRDMAEEALLTANAKVVFGSLPFDYALKVKILENSEEFFPRTSKGKIGLEHLEN